MDVVKPEASVSMSDSLFNTGVRPVVDEHLAKLSAERRDYGKFWSASSSGYCQRKVIFDRLHVPKVKEDARKQRVFSSGHIFHEWIQGITKEAGISIAQEVEIQDEDLMIRGHFDDLVLIKGLTEADEGYNKSKSHDSLILYDYKTQNSKNFATYAKKPSYYHKLQLGTYTYMLRNMYKEKGSFAKHFEDAGFDTTHPYTNLTEARILKISKDDLRLAEVQYMWSDELEKEVLDYWNTLNNYWKTRTLPPCTCADHENGFLAKEQWNDYFYNDSPCSVEWFAKYPECKAKWEGLTA